MTTLRTRLCEQYGLEAPIVSAAMGFVALPELACAISNAGGLGFIGASPEPPPVLSARIAALRAGTKKPFGVGFIIATSGLGEFVTHDHITVCAASRVPVVSFHWAVPPSAWIRELHDAGTKVWVQAHSLELAREAVEVGADAIIAQGSEAGGHNRNREQRTLELLVHLRAALPAKIVLLAAGGIATGQRLAEAVLAGADGAWIGTRFVASLESHAHPGFKERLVKADLHATVVQTVFGPEWPEQPQRVLRVRALAESAQREPSVIGHTTLFPGVLDAPYDMPKHSAIVPTRATVGDLEEMDMPAGSDSAALVREVLPAAEIVRELVRDASAALVRPER